MGGVYNVGLFEHMRKEVTPLKGTARYELPALSPQHERADYSRKILRINEVIRSLLSISHMERMDLIAINNRSLCNHSKIKRAQRTTRKLSNSNNLPDLKEIRLDNRRRGILSTLKPRASNLDSQHIAETELCEKYIEEYLQKLKDEKRFDILADRAKLIEQACREIIARIDASKKRSARAGEKMSNGVNQVENSEMQVREVRLPMNARVESGTFKSIEIRRSSEYSSKTRALNEKMFLRKIKQIKLHSQPE